MEGDLQAIDDYVRILFSMAEAAVEDQDDAVALSHVARNIKQHNRAIWEARGLICNATYPFPANIKKLGR